MPSTATAPTIQAVWKCVKRRVDGRRRADDRDEDRDAEHRADLAGGLVHRAADAEALLGEPGDGCRAEHGEGEARRRARRAASRAATA